HYPTCRAGRPGRNARGEHDFAATDAEFDLITRHFSVPSEEEGLVIEVHRP
ncbi:ATP-binding protein, partial [Pseudomonas lactis]|nr:ATP-binding protein [Pseudomonas lactis]